MALVDGVARLSGTLAVGSTVDRLILRRTGSPGKSAHVLGQAPGRDFDFSLGLASIRDGLDADEGSYDLFLGVTTAGKAAELRLGNFSLTDRDRAVDPVVVGATKSWLHVTAMGNVCLQFGPEQPHRIRTKTRRLVTGADRVRFDILLETFNRPVESVIATWVGRESRRRTEVELAVTAFAADRNAGLFGYEVSGEFALDAAAHPYDGADVLFDLHLEVTLRGSEPQRRGIKAAGSRWAPRPRELVTSTGGETHVFIPHFTFRGQRLAFWAETFTDDNYRLIRRLRYVSWLFLLARPFLRIWLVGETPYKAQDNGFHFFRWMRTEHPGRRVFYVLEPDSPDLARVATYGNVIERFSRKHIVCTLLASRFVGSHHAEYLFASRMRSMIRRSSGRRIFLQHGVTAAKNVTLNYGRRKVAEMPADVFIVNSPLERDIVVQDLLFLPSQVKITGFARFDSLFDDDVEVERSILVMPTWRDWLMRHEAFVESDYLERWLGFLQHPQLKALSAEFDVRIRFVLHPNMRHYADYFAVDGIDLVLPGDEDVQHLIKRSAVMVTDYSSVAWDFAFLGKPVHYFQFDQSRFIGDRQPHIDYATALPGTIARREDDLVEDLRVTLQSGMRVSEEFERRSRAFLTHRDQDNCRRIFDVVTHARGPGAALTRLRNARRSRNAFDRFRNSGFYDPAMTWVYRLVTFLPKRKVIVFGSDHGLAYAGSPRYLFERLQERGGDYDLVYVNNGTVRLPGHGADKVAGLTPKHHWLMARAKFWIDNQHVDARFRPSRHTQFVQTWHGPPVEDANPGTTEAEEQTLVSYWGTLVSSGRHTTAAFRSAFGFDGRIVESGDPRSDLFFAHDRDYRVQVVKNRLGVGVDQKVVLFAPATCASARRDPSRDADMVRGVRRMRDELGAGFVVLLRLPGFDRRSLDNPEAPGDFVLDVSHYGDVQELLLISDALITDNSPLMFDYSCLDRPMIFFDAAHDRDSEPGLAADFAAPAPGPSMREATEAIASLRDLDRIAVDYAVQRAEFRHKFCPLADGRASDRVLDAVLGQRLPPS